MAVSSFLIYDSGMEKVCETCGENFMIHERDLAFLIRLLL